MRLSSTGAGRNPKSRHVSAALSNAPEDDPTIQQDPGAWTSRQSRRGCDPRVYEPERTLNYLAAPGHASLLCKRILVVEDDDCLYQALRDSLKDAGCEVFGSCERVCYPIDTVPASRLDAALIDMDPLGSGRAALLAQQLRQRNIPIVWITARGDSSFAPVSQAHEWLRKPFTEGELLDSIACAVGKSM